VSSFIRKSRKQRNARCHLAIEVKKRDELNVRELVACHAMCNCEQLEFYLLLLHDVNAAFVYYMLCQL